MSDILKYNPATFLVEVDKDYVTSIKEFKALIVRDKGTKGDTQARKKLQALKEFTFIYHYCSYKSQFINFPEVERRFQALKNAELPTNLKIEEDEELIQAIETYIALQETPSLSLLLELKEGLHTARKVVKKVRQDLEKMLEAVDLDELIPDEETKGKKILDPITKITNRLNSLTDIGNKLPNTLETIEKLEEKVKKQLADNPQLRGGASKGTREDAQTHNRGTVTTNPLED